MQQYRPDLDESALVEKVVHVSRVAKVVKGGRRFSFSAIVVVGNGRGKVGYGLGKAAEVPEAIRKGTEKAKKAMIQVDLAGTTVPHMVTGKTGSGLVLLKPAAKGTGVIAGGSVRAVVEAAGVKDLLSKVLGSNNPHNVVRATMNALSRMNLPKTIAKRRGVPPERLRV
jgi:small subunit ribosomal protein S5